MQNLEKIFAWFFPRLLISGTRWEEAWDLQEWRSFRLVARIVFPIVAVICVMHFYFYDVPMDLKPIARWMTFRFSLASFAFFAFLYYWFNSNVSKYYNLPAVVVLWAICASQGLAMVWYGQETWIFGFILVVASTILLRLSPLGSILFCFVAIGSLIPFYSYAGLGAPDIATGSMVSMTIALLARSSSMSDVQNFLLTQQNTDAQTQIAELSNELADRTRAFVPREIAFRVDNSVSVDRRSVIDAYIEILQPAQKNIACLFSDIRGFTKNSEDLTAFIGESVFPELKACSNAVEDRHGIPRKVGDLIFAYFDSESQVENDARVLASGFEIARINMDFNRTSSSKQIKRYILISCGSAVVGNIGGFDSSIEITALGPPVNFLSRLDEATKVERLASKLETGDLIVSKQFFDRCDLLKSLRWEMIDLKQIGIVVRDFSTERYVVRIPYSEENYEASQRGLTAH